MEMHLKLNRRYCHVIMTIIWDVTIKISITIFSDTLYFIQRIASAVNSDLKILTLLYPRMFVVSESLACMKTHNINL
jgi:hypothetical protein